MSLRGSVDSLDVEGAMGWIFDGGAGSAGEPVVVQGLLAGRIIGEAVAELPRPDLAAAGLGAGRCGFAMRFYEALDPALLPFVAVKPQGGDVELPRTNLTGFGDFFRAVAARHPGAGRHRSVFGGLWTDRTDAPRVLAGRVAAGTTPAELEPVLRVLVAEGHALLRGVLAPAGLDAAGLALAARLPADRPLDPREEPEARALLEALPGVIFREPALRALRAVLDDNPVAYRAVLSRAGEDEAAPPPFAQASAAEALPSPAECLAVLACAGRDAFLLDVVRGSHALPEFTPDGRSRWLQAGAGAAVELAVAHGASVETVEVGPQDLALVGPGTLHRVRTPGEAVALTALVAPSRVTPLRVLSGSGGGFTVRHHSGAGVTV
jgi:hypothetical protein